MFIALAPAELRTSSCRAGVYKAGTTASVLRGGLEPAAGSGLCLPSWRSAGALPATALVSEMVVFYCLSTSQPQKTP